MALQMIIGRSGSGKSQYILEQVAQTIQGDPFGEPIIIIVPEQMSFQTEYQLLTQYQVHGSFRAQVYSFTRLAWRVFQETGGLARELVSPMGIQMLLRKIVEEKKGELRAFQRAATQAGFYEQLARMITELKRYLYTPSQVGEWLPLLQPTQSGEGMLADKLHDLHLIYTELEEILLPHYVEHEDYLPLLAAQISQSQELKRATIWMDGFYSFTPQELLVIQRLLQACPEVKLALTIDPAYIEGELDSTHLFFETHRTYHQLLEVASLVNTQVEAPLVLRRSAGKVHPSILHLEQQYESRPATPYEGETAISIATATNRRAEVEGVARQIIQLARDEGYRWRDVALFVRKLEPYEQLIQQVFQSYQIPVFLDGKRSIMHHPLIELLRSSLDVVVHHWGYEAVFRCIKTDLFYQKEEGIPQQSWREEMDQLENLALEYGIKGSRWVDEQFWEQLSSSLSEERREILQYRRKQVVTPLMQLEGRLQGAHSLREQVEALYQFLLQLGVPTTLEEWSEEAEQLGELEEARDHEQAWQIVMELFDQLVEVMGEESFSLELLQEILETGLENHHFSLVPPALDHVFVGVLDRSRLQGVRAAFILGVNDGLLPAKPDEGGMLDEWERTWLQEQGLELAPGSREQLLQEDFLLYIACSRPQEHLYFSYALADEEGKALTPSLVINRMQQLVPHFKAEYWSTDPADLVDGDEQYHYLVRPNKALSFLVVQLRQWLRGYPIEEFWWDTYNWLLREKQWKLPLQQLLRSLFYQNQERDLPSPWAEELYGKEFATSVSRMEQFQACPFAHFASYGLKLEERKLYRLTAPDLGRLFHQALQWIDMKLRQGGHSWSELSPIQCEQLAREAVQALAPAIQQAILFSSQRHLYVKRKLEQVIGKTAQTLSQHARQSLFEPLGYEVEFSRQRGLQPLQFPLPHGGKMWVEGRIDRVDIARGTEGLYLRVIDYKSSPHDLDLVQVYYGLQLQMLTYLDVVLRNAPKWLGEEALPAGVLYFHIHNPILRAQSSQPLDQIEEALYKQFKMKGLLLADDENVELMDQGLMTEPRSPMIPVERKKDGTFSARSSVATPDKFQQIQHHVQRVIQQIGSRIASGDVKIDPYRYGSKNACSFCPYRSVCQFDETIPGNQYRMIPDLDKKEVFHLLDQEGGMAE